MQLTKLSNLRKENVIFNETKEYTVKNSKLKYHRIKTEKIYPNSKKGQLVIETTIFVFLWG